MREHPAAVVSDANVLIDYISVDRTLVLRLVSEHLFPIKLPQCILDEVDEFSQGQAEAIGIEVIEESIEQITEASIRGGALSREDKLCFVIARDNNWAIWTSDKPLHTKCKTEDIPVYWGLQLMLELCLIGKLEPAYALEAAQAIEQVNERITTEIINRFREELG